MQETDLVRLRHMLDAAREAIGLIPVKEQVQTSAVRVLQSDDPGYPSLLAERLGDEAPGRLAVLGNVTLLDSSLTALFCSSRAPGDAILRALDTARDLRDAGVTAISGFHSPLEKECLRVLLRGSQPIVYAVARSLDRMRIPSECRPAFDAGRLLFVSPFVGSPRRLDRQSSSRRNDVVGALARVAFIANGSANGEVARVLDRLRRWGVPTI